MSSLACSAIVLCGGSSTRMGRDKASLPFGPETLLERVIRLVREEVDDIVLAAGPTQEVPSGCEVVRDSAEGLGPLPALLNGLGHVQNERVFLVSCDAALLRPEIIPLLLELSIEWDASVPIVGGVQMAACAVYRTAPAMRVAGQLMATDSPSLTSLATRLRTRYVYADELSMADPGLLSFTPCNTPEEYRQALELAELDGG